MKLNQNLSRNDSFWFCSGRLGFLDRKTLRLKSVKRSDRGTYSCTVDHQDVINPNANFTQTQVAQIFVDVREAPILLQHSDPRQVVDEGKEVSLFCQWTGHPKPNTSWFRGPPGQQVLVSTASLVSGEPGISVQQMDEGPAMRTSSLRISSASHLHADIYTCLASNSEGSVEANISVIVRGGIYFTQRPINQSVLEGTESVTFSCRAISETGPVSNAWLKDGKTLKMRHSVDEYSGDLIIRGVTRQDRGLYTCQPQSTPRISASAFLDVLFPVLATMPHIDTLYLALGGSGRIPCEVKASPAVFTVQWQKEGTVSTAKSHFGQIIDGMLTETEKNELLFSLSECSALERAKAQRELVQSPLCLCHAYFTKTATQYWHTWKPVSEVDAGLYRCRGRNQLNWGHWSNTLQVIVRPLPRFSQRPQPMYILNGAVMTERALTQFAIPCITLVKSASFAANYSEMHDMVRIIHGGQGNVSNLWKVSARDLELLERGAPISVESEVKPLPSSAVVDEQGNLRFRSPVNLEELEGAYHCIAYNPLVMLIASTHIRVRHREDQQKSVIPAHPLNIRVQPDDALHFWLYGLVPSEVYAIRIRPWCGSKTVHKHSSMLHVKTLPLFKSFGETPVRSLDQEPGLIANEQLAEPWGLAVNYTGDPSSKNSPLSISLVWKQDSALQLHPPTLWFQVEYCFFSGAAVAKPSWKTLAPIDGASKEMVLLSKKRSSNQYENVYETGVMFRIRAYGLMVASKASEELVLAPPTSTYVGQALRNLLTEESGNLQKSLEQAAKDLQEMKRKYASHDGVMLDESLPPKTSPTQSSDRSSVWWNWWTQDNMETHITWSVVASLLFIVCFFSVGLIVIRKVTKSANKYNTTSEQNPTSYEMDPWTPSHPVYASLSLRNQMPSQSAVFHECEATDTLLKWKSARATLGNQYAVDLTSQRPETYEIFPTKAVQE
ncbi:Protein turtle B [Cichlidogyrus casuarinus]|uniref:Protein turtle B n=1 Tax=Cichlidogyrus casuarinus TaxID=1844966 RepID=A0ABD2Q9C2_9PLAT